MTNPYSPVDLLSLNYTSARKSNMRICWKVSIKAGIIQAPGGIATYTHLDPGKYTFKVRGMRNDGDGLPVLHRLN